MTRWQHRLLTLLAALALLASALAIGLAHTNADLRRDIGQQQRYVQQTAPLENLYREMVRALAEWAARHPDEPLRALLQRHGVEVAPTAPAAPAAPARK